MNEFAAKNAYAIRRVLSGFDRRVLRGTMRRLSFAEGLCSYLV